MGYHPLFMGFLSPDKHKTRKQRQQEHELTEGIHMSLVLTKTRRTRCSWSRPTPKAWPHQDFKCFFCLQDLQRALDKNETILERLTSTPLERVQTTPNSVLASATTPSGGSAPDCFTSAGQVMQRVLPWRVVHAWDFTLFPVSRMAASYLDAIDSHAMISLSHYNASLYSKVRRMAHCRVLRTQLKSTCEVMAKSSCDPCLATFHVSEQLAYEDADLWSLKDLRDVNQGVLAKWLMKAVNASAAHIMKKCVRCREVGGKLCVVCFDPSFDIRLPGLQDAYLCQVSQFVPHLLCRLVLCLDPLFYCWFLSSSWIT